MAVQNPERSSALPLGAAKRVLVTGAHGFVGRHVARFYARQGHSVSGIGHGDWQRQEWTQWGLSAWQASDITLASLQKYAERPEIVLHCAGTGSVGFAINHPLAALERTVVSTAHVLEYIRLHAPGCVFVYPSSASVYGNVDRVPIAEESLLAPISQYGTHKIMVEQMMVSFSRQFGTRTAIVRFFSLYGCGLRKQLLWDACAKLHHGDAIFMGTGDELRDWLHVEEAAELMATAAEKASPLCPIVNGGSGQGVAVRDVLEHLAATLGNEARVTFNGERRPGDPVRYVADIGRATAWKWQPTRDLRDGVREYASWWTRDVE